MGFDRQRVREGFGQGVRTALRNNLSAFGFSVMITAAFGMLSADQGAPEMVDVFSFAAGAVTGVAAVDAISSHGFRAHLREEKSDVVALGAVLSYVSVGAAISATAGVGEVLRGILAWGLGSFVACVFFVLLSGLELTFARIAQERRDEEDEEDEEADG